MLHIFKKFMAFLTLISVLSSSAWACSPVVLFDDAATVQAVNQDIHLIPLFPLHFGEEISIKAPRDSFCNHACHISAHMLGIVTSEAKNVVPKLDSTIFNIESDDQLTNPILKSLYRPPAFA